MSAKAKSKLTPEQRNATLRRVLEKIRPYGFFVVCSLIVAAVSVAAQLYIPILCGSAIDMMLGKGNVDFNGVLRIVVEIVIVAVVAAFAQWLLSVCNNRITFSVSRDLRNAALRKIQTLPLSYLDSHPSGDIVSRMVADVDTFADGLLMGFTQLFSGVLTILGTLLFMLSENVPITLVVVCITPLSLVVASFLAKRSYKYFQGQSTVRGEQTALVNEMIEGQKVVQAFGHEAESLAAFDEVNGRLQSVSLKAIFFSSMTNPATRFVNNIVYAGVGLVGAVYAVAGGIPIVQTLKESLTGNHITSLEGILNGTGNYILSEMTSKGVNFAPALAEAQEKGYAEADPTLDIDGFDTAHKLVLLIRLAWGVDYPYTKMPIEGIRNLDKMDIDFAREFGYRIKLLGRARMRDGKLEAGVFPTLVNHTYLLARVGGAYNAVRVEGNAVGSLFLHGLGAGSLPTASAVLGDLISIARQNNKLNSGFVKQVLPQADILPPEEACSTYYMRFMVKDDPGVLRDLSGALSDQGVSIAQAIQKGQSEAGVPLVFMTHEAPVSAIRKAVETMRKSDFLLAPAICYRVMG